MTEPDASAGQPGTGPGDAMPAGDVPGPAAVPADGGTTASGTTEATATSLIPPEAVVAGASTQAARRRSPFYLRGRKPRLPQSRRGLFALLLVLGALGAVATFSAVSLIQWTETADFCGRCHVMAPELAAYEAGPHRDVACAECHVEPGIMGWVKAKVAGTRQLIEVILGTYPTPILAPDHADMPSASDTCMQCHDISQDAVTDVKTVTEYVEDEANTPLFVGLMIRPRGGNVFDVNASVHWHVLHKVTYWGSELNGKTVDYVEATTQNGSVDEFIAYNKIKVSSDVQPDIAALKASDTPTVMSCYDCHNRVGHSIPNPRTELDQALSTGAIDATLPWVKNEGMHILTTTYPDNAAADAAAEGLLGFYQLNYPAVADTQAAQINAAVDEIKVLYRLTAMPDLKVSAKTYPDNLGHTDFPGCFRCHDGGHYLVVNGVVTNQTIPSTCDTCHTFPQIGPAVASLPLGQPPTTHEDQLWVFDHKTVATSADPGGQSCGECHARDYCVNCHSTGAINVDHDQMATNHAAVIRATGATACTYCHLPVQCARCHADQVLPVTTPFLQGSVPLQGATSGVSWPLTPDAQAAVAAGQP